MSVVLLSSTAPVPDVPAARAARPGLRRLVGAALALLLLLPLTSACGPDLGGGTRTITASFSDTAGLFVGNDVGVLGVSIGTITAIEPKGATVEVTMQVDADRTLPADVGAVVVARSVATDRYVELTPVYDGGATLGADGRIPVERTRTPVDFDQVLEALNTFATGIAGSEESKDAIRRIIEDGSAALDGKGQLVNDTVSDLAGATSDLAGKRQEVAALVRALDSLVATLAANEQTTREFIDQVGAAADLLDDQKVDFRRALRNLDKAVTTIAAFAADHRDELVQVVDGGTQVLRTVDSRQRQLAEILEVFPLALQNLQRAGSGDRLAVRTSPLVLLPLGEQLGQICADLPLGLCDLLGGSDPADRPAAGGR